MSYIRVIVILLTALCLSNAVWADKISLNALSSYLNGLRNVEAKFTQINADGSLSTGVLYIKRPGRIRVEYDPPNNALVLASQGQLAIFDPNGNNGPESYPLSKTPLSLILADNINLSRERMVRGHQFDGTSTTLTVQDPEHPERGLLVLVFTGPSPQLRQWVIEGQNGEQTVIVLNDVAMNMFLNDNLFNVFLNQEQRRTNK
jgi:outer membrane lipoprotein-sorting protein